MIRRVFHFPYSSLDSQMFFATMFFSINSDAGWRKPRWVSSFASLKKATAAKLIARATDVPSGNSETIMCAGADCIASFGVYAAPLFNISDDSRKPVIPGMKSQRLY